MRKFFRIVVMFTAFILASYAENENEFRDPVTGESIFDDSAADAIIDLKQKVNSFHDSVMKTLPKEIRLQLLSCETFESISSIPMSSQLWLGQNAGHIDENVAQSINAVRKHITCHGDAFNSMMKEAFWCRIHNKPFDFFLDLYSAVISWKENHKPAAEHSPNGLGRIDWIWKLDSKDRLNGVMHVGIDVKKRNFVCFERNLGVYFPEGDKLERIYEEIVQDPAMAGDHIGAGRRKSK
jgi:hypothetical protein